MAALLLAGCGGGGDDESATSTTVADTTDPPTTTEPTTTTTEPRTPEEEVEEAYWEAERVLDDLLQAPDPDDPRLAETRVDPSLSHMQTYLEGLRDDGVAARPVGGEMPESEIRAIQVTGDSARVKACYIDNLVVVDVGTEDVLSDSVTTAVVETTLVRISEVWKVSDSITSSEWDDGLGCDR